MMVFNEKTLPIEVLFLQMQIFTLLRKPLRLYAKPKISIPPHILF